MYKTLVAPKENRDLSFKLFKECRWVVLITYATHENSIVWVLSNKDVFRYEFSR